MTDKYAVIGNPIAHSKSPLIHAAFAKQFENTDTPQDISYDPKFAGLDSFEAKVQELIVQGYKGANVTVPFKFEAFQLCDDLTERARSAGAVNTLLFKQNKIFGDNTDGLGLVADIVKNLHVTINKRSVLLMGAGGAANGVVLPLLEAGAILSVANRTVQKAEELANKFNLVSDKFTHVYASSYAGFKDKGFNIVINATSSGLTDELPAISSTNFDPNALAYDMMYSRETAFKKLADDCQSKNVKFADGLGMLVEQAAEAFYLWRGVRPETAPVIKMMRNLK